jgi:hypothetical protein
MHQRPAVARYSHKDLIHVHGCGCPMSRRNSTKMRRRQARETEDVLGWEDIDVE